MDNEKLTVRGRDGSHDVLLICSPYSNCQHIGAEGSDTVLAYVYRPSVQSDLPQVDQELMVLEIQLRPVHITRDHATINEVQLSRVVNVLLLRSLLLSLLCCHR